RPIASIGYAKGDVLTHAHETQVGGLDAERCKRLQGGRCIGLRRVWGHGRRGHGLRRHGLRRHGLWGHAASSAMVASQATRNSAASACENGSGGRIFTTLAKAPALLIRKPLSFNRLITSLARSVSGALSAGLTSSTPMNRPWPRTSPI